MGLVYNCWNVFQQLYMHCDISMGPLSPTPTSKACNYNLATKKWVEAAKTYLKSQLSFDFITLFMILGGRSSMVCTICVPVVNQFAPQHRTRVSFNHFVYTLHKEVIINPIYWKHNSLQVYSRGQFWCKVIVPWQSHNCAESEGMKLVLLFNEYIFELNISCFSIFQEYHLQYLLGGWIEQ